VYKLAPNILIFVKREIMTYTENTHVVGNINYKTLRDFILDNNLKEDEIIYLNTYDLDDLVLDYRSFYKSAMPADIKILCIAIKEATTMVVYRRHIKVISPIRQKEDEYTEPRLKWRDYFKW
jgi:hypothetical protein